MSNPRLGRFFAIDPLVKSYPWYSPYQFAGNQVIKARELEGLEPDVDVNLQATVVIAFGSGGQSNTRISFGAGFSAKGGTNDASAQTSINFAFTLSDGGLGTTQGSSGQNQFQGSFVISPALTIGGGTGKSLPTNTFTSSTITGVNNTFNTSFTIGQNFVFDSRGRNQRVGFFGARFEKRICRRI